MYLLTLWVYCRFIFCSAITVFRVVGCRLEGFIALADLNGELLCYAMSTLMCLPWLDVTTGCCYGTIVVLELSNGCGSLVLLQVLITSWFPFEG